MGWDHLDFALSSPSTPTLGHLRPFPSSPLSLRILPLLSRKVLAGSLTERWEIRTDGPLYCFMGSTGHQGFWTPNPVLSSRSFWMPHTWGHHPGRPDRSLPVYLYRCLKVLSSLKLSLPQRNRSCQFTTDSLKVIIPLLLCFLRFVLWRSNGPFLMLTF